jgi:hypothetical protein
MKKLSFQASDSDITVPTNQFDDSFAVYLDSVLEYFEENFDDCKLTIGYISDKSVILTTSEGTCKENLNKSISKGQIKKSEEKPTSVTIKWVGSSAKKTEVPGDDDFESTTSAFDAFIQPLANKVAGAISTAGKLVSHYERDEDKKLVENIERIKELLK